MRELARQIKEAAYLTGEFTLRSGLVSSFYWDKYRFESDPGLLRTVTIAMMELLPRSYDRLAGLELGGVPLATALSLKIGKPALYVRKETKAYGTCNLIEGGFQRGETAVVIEDVVTSGGQVVASVQQMRELGLVVEDVVCVIDRQQGGAESIATRGCNLSAVFTLSELERLGSDREN